MRPIILFLLLFVITPLTELYVLIAVGAKIGALSTILLTLLTATVGILLVRTQGLVTALQANAAMGRGEIPAVAMLEGVVLVLCGVLLLLPGFITDTIGFLLLIPALRYRVLLYMLQSAAVTAHAHAHNSTDPDGFSANYHKDEEVVEGEYEEVSRPKPSIPHTPSDPYKSGK